MVKKLMKFVHKYYSGVTYKALFLTAYFGFFRLSSLLPSAADQFNKTSSPIVEDVVSMNHDVHISITCAKHMQISGEYHIVQLPELSNPLICPALALKNKLKERKYESAQCLFQIYTKNGLVPLIASNVRSFFKTSVASFNPSHYKINSFRRSGTLLPLIAVWPWTILNSMEL